MLMSTKSLIGRVRISHHLFRLSPRGFTLIELLIVVAIIAVLIGVGSVSFTTARRQGRDATRKADLEKVASAFEQYFADNTSYPIDNGSGIIQCDDPIPTNKAWGSSFSCVVGSETKVYLQELPQDPSTSAGHPQYYYDSQTRSGDSSCAEPFCQQFILEAQLEQTPTGLDCIPVLHNYCVVSPGYEAP